MNRFVPCLCLVLVATAACASAGAREQTRATAADAAQADDQDAWIAERLEEIRASDASTPRLSDLPPAPADLRTPAQWEKAYQDLRDRRNSLLTDPEVASEAARVAPDAFVEAMQDRIAADPDAAER